MTAPTPPAVTTARVLAIVQAIFDAGCAILCSSIAAVSYHSDKVAAQAGHANEFAGVGEVLGTIGALVMLAAAALVGIPALLLAGHRRGARTLLILAESGSAVFVAAMLMTYVGSAGIGTILAAAYAALAVTVIVALLSEPARVWSMTVPAYRPSRRTTVAGC